MGSYYTVVQRDYLTLSIIENITAGKLVTPTPTVDDILRCYHLHRTVYFLLPVRYKMIFAILKEFYHF